MSNSEVIPEQVDVAIIGAGSAGLPAFRNARANTENVVIIEGGPYGTTCARVGCMPSKLLIAAAEAAHSIESSAPFGVHASKPEINGKEVMARVRNERDRFVGFVLEGVEKIPAKHKIQGHAKFENDQTLSVNGQNIKAKSIVIATGSSPIKLPIFDGLGDRLIINDDVFNWQDLPESVAVFGPGVIGLELGQALHRLGVRIRMFGIQKLLGPLTDKSIREYAEKTFQAEFPLDTDADVKKIERTGDQVKITFVDSEDGTEKAECFDFVLTATGRSPNVKNLGLENTSLELDSRGVPVYDSSTMQCGNTSIFIAGDANNELPLLHEASDEGTIAGKNAGQFPKVESGLRRTPISVVFSDPQIAMVGQTWSQLEGQKNVVVGKMSFEGQGRSRVMLKNKGLMHVYADSVSGRFLGSEFMAPQAEHMAHLLSWAHQKQMTIAEMLEMPFYHPVIEEGLRTALRDAAAQIGV